MVLLPNPSEDVLAGGSPSASTELASEGTPLAKVVSSSTNATPPSQQPVVPMVVVAVSAASVMSGKDSTVVVPTSTTPPTNETTGDDVTESSSSSSSSSSSVSVTSTSSTAKALSSYLARPLSPYRPSHAQLSTVNPCITCNLCKGYLIDATTIVECLHSFCHSCIMKHLRTEQYCPQCEMMINKAKPNIKPDATLQAIVYKLVPGLYENELRRRRAFYRQHPEMAAIATPEQRGDDTEHLIFGPNEKISLSLEYAEKELAQDNEELLTPKYLLCPALFSIAHLKKFIIFKYGISERQFCVEIMYKVKTIILPDYYTLMDVAYIYTWKRDAPMKYFYRIRTTESYPEELAVDMPLRRTPSISSQSQESYRSNEEDDKENIGSSGQECKQRGSEPNESKPPRLECSVVHGTPPARKSGMAGAADQPSNGSSTPTVSTPSTTTVPSRKNEAIKLKIELNKNKYVSFLQSPQADIPVKSEKPEKVKRKKTTFDSSGSPASAHHHRRTPPPPSSVAQVSPSGQGADLKIKIEKIKYATPKDGKSGKKSSPPYKVELSPGLSQGLSVSSSSWEVEEPKRSSSSKSSLSLSKKLKLSKSSTSLEVKHPIVLKIDQRSPDMATSTLKFEVTPKVSPKSKATSPLPMLPPLAPSPPAPKFEDEQSQFLNSFQLAPIKSLSEEAESKAESKKEPAGKQSPSAASEPPKKASSPTSTSPSSTPSKAVNGSSIVAANGGTLVPSAKRKAKEPAQRPDESTKRSKKPKLSDEEMKAMVEQKVAENINSPRGCIVPPIFFRPTGPSSATPASRSSISPPAGEKPLDKKPRKPRTNSAKPMPTTPKRDSPRPFVVSKSLPGTTPSAFMPPPPPPIVSATNIPAVKPSQPVVIPVPILLKPEAAQKKDSKHPTSSPITASPKPVTVPTSSQPSLLIPNRRPTMPTKLPTSQSLATSQTAATASTPKEPTTLDTAKPKKQALELKRAQSNPSVNIIPPTPRDTEISKLRPEDMKKNAKVYGPPETSPFTPPKPVVKTDAGGFVVPTKTAPKPATGSSSSSSSSAITGANSSVATNSTTTTSANVPAGPGKGARPVNYLNYALYNSKAAPAGSRTPIPSYSISSPSYSPDSPQYSPNFNISTKQYKYVNPLACTNFLQNMLTDRKSGDNISPPLPTQESPKVGGAITVSSGTSKTPSPPLVPVKSEVASPLKPPSTPPTVDRKRPASAMSPDNSGNAVEPPVDKKPIVQSILAMNIPSSLSITLATEEDEVARQAARKIRESDPANNHIEIVKLPDVPISEVSPKSITPTTSPGSISPPSIAPAKKEVPPKIPTPPAITPQKVNEGFQKKFLDAIDVKQSDPPVLVTTVGMTAPTISTTPSSTVSASKTSNAISSRRLSVGCFPVTRYPEIDLTKSSASTVSSKASRPPAVPINSAPIPSPKTLMPPPKMLPIGMKHSPSTGSLVSGSQHPKAISPPIPKSSLSPVLSPKPRPGAHTTPPALPSLASMGPMFGIQMKSDANALQNGSGNGTPMKKPSLPPTLPRRKIVPANNTTSLVPLKTSPPSGTMKPSVGSMGNAADYITLHPQISSTPQGQQHQPQKQQQKQQQQQQQLQQQLPPNFTNGAMLPSAALYSNLLNQHQQQQQQQHQQKVYEQFMTDVMRSAHIYQQLAASQANYGQDSLTITTSPSMRSPHPNLAPYHQLQQNLMNSLTVTAIRGGQQTSGSNGTGGNTGGSPTIASNGGAPARSGQAPKMSTMKSRPGGGGPGTPGTGPGANPTKGVS
ncbi:polycomb group protein Psc [Anopheles darlingi]|uniref:polycomb group protein Psc n=1 Tax=Anopheles darlingi TaxID=43151 RepID=UPI00210002CA|nr:polycomb group protein Psc [Anopheles darlingi]